MTQPISRRRHASALDGRVSVEWSRCPDSMAGHAGDSVAATKLSRLDACKDWKVAGYTGV